MKVLGSVPEGDDLVHVLIRTRMSMQGVPMTDVEVLSLRKGDAGWGVLLNRDLEAFIELFGTLMP